MREPFLLLTLTNSNEGYDDCVVRQEVTRAKWVMTRATTDRAVFI